MIDPESYRGSLATQFAPKTRTGDAGFGDLAGGSAWAQDSYRGGFGYPEWDAEHRDRFADGTGLDISYGDLRLGRALTFVMNTDLWACAQYTGKLYGIETSGSQVWQTSDGSTWTVAVNLSTIAVAAGGVAMSALRSIWVQNQYLFVGSGSNGQLFYFDGTTWAMVTIPAGTWPLFVSAISAGLQYTYSVDPSTSTVPTSIVGTEGGIAYPGPVLDTKTCFFAAVTPTAIGTGPNFQFPDEQVAALMTTNPGTLHIGTLSDELTPGSIEGSLYFWTLGGTSAGSLRLLHHFFDNAITSFVQYGGKLLAGSRVNGVIWEVTDSGVQTFFTIPELAEAGTPPVYNYSIPRMCVDNDRLYVGFLDVTGRSVLYQYDGQGWCRFASPSAGYAGTPRGVYTYRDALIYLTSAAVLRAPRAYAASGDLITSWFDADLPGIDKAPAEITITHTPLTTGQSIAVDYATDYETGWHSLGVSNTVGAMDATFTFPTLTCDRIRFRYTLAGFAGSTTSVKLRSGVMGYQLVPDVKREWRFTTLLAGCPGGELIRYDNSLEPKTAAELSDTLWASKADKAQSAFTDIDGATYSVWFDELAEEVDRGRPRQELATRGIVRLVEA